MSTLQQTVLACAICAVMTTSVALYGQHEEFGYSGPHGPAQWAHTAGWEACAGGTGKRQSPIAINHVTVDRALQPLQLIAKPTPVALENNGHTVEQEYEPGTAITVGGARYELAQFHFHAPSEHTVDGHHAPLELHAVFAEPNSPRKAVIGQLYIVGKSNPFSRSCSRVACPQNRASIPAVPAASMSPMRSPTWGTTPRTTDH